VGSDAKLQGIESMKLFHSINQKIRDASGRETLKDEFHSNVCTGVCRGRPAGRQHGTLPFIEKMDEFDQVYRKMTVSRHCRNNKMSLSLSLTDWKSKQEVKG
jgi:hypothetical protein